VGHSMVEVVVDLISSGADPTMYPCDVEPNDELSPPPTGVKHPPQPPVTWNVAKGAGDGVSDGMRRRRV
jgi:hypothetical protein